LDLCALTCVTEDLVYSIDHPSTLCRAEVDGSAVNDSFRSDHHTPHDVPDICPVANLCSVTPDLEGVLIDERTRNHRDHSVILNTPLPIYREKAACRRLHGIVMVIRLKSHFGH